MTQIRVCDDDECNWIGLGCDCVHPEHAESLSLCPVCNETTHEITPEIVKVWWRDRKKLQQENERMRNALQKIADWQNAYPIETFQEPDLKRAHEVLKEAGMGLDGISASNMRHVLIGIKEIVNVGLGL
jgi:hypothetical protein